AKFQENGPFDLIMLKEQVVRWQIKKINYEFKQANTDSKMAITFYLQNRLAGELTATSVNCEQLYFIFKKYICPNVI
ncbi:MAG: hypothetical protein WCB79_01725, partial [Halobacteriota archaeon]